MQRRTITACVLTTCLYAANLHAAKRMPATTTYQITQVTSGAFNHKWPSINNNGDTVWSQQVGGLWQVYILKSGSTTPSPIPVPNTSHNREYPDIDNTGDITYLEDGQGAGPGLAVIKNTGGVESTVEYSSGNPPGCTEPPAGPATCTSWRAAGQHFGIAGNGTIISYHDFCSPSCTRNFDVSGIGQLSGTWNGADYPDINGQGIFVYTAGGSIFSATTAAPNSPTLIASGGNPRIADGSVSPEIVYVAAGQVISTVGGTVASGIWADIGMGGTIVFEQTVSGFSQVFVAVPNSCGSLRTVLSSAQAASCPPPTIAGPSQVWWFNGLTPSPTGYDTIITLTANPPTGSSYQWNVSGSAVFTGGATSPTALLEATSWSVNPGDVIVTVTVDGQTSKPFSITARAPTLLLPYKAAATFANTQHGYLTLVYYSVRDQFVATFPNTVIGINETLGAGIPNPGVRTNWTNKLGHPNGTLTKFVQGQGQTATDQLAPPGPPSKDVPQPLYDSQYPPFPGTEVMYRSQTFQIGSETVGEGCKVQQDTIQLYTDHGDAEAIISGPPPCF